MRPLVVACIRLYGRGPTGHYLCNIALYKPDLASHGIEDLGYDGVAPSVPEYVQEITIVPQLFTSRNVVSDEHNIQCYHPAAEQYFIYNTRIFCVSDKDRRVTSVSNMGARIRRIAIVQYCMA